MNAPMTQAVPEPGGAHDLSLRGWDDFARTRLPPTTASDERFVLFHARWRLASSFEHLYASGFSDRVRDGYSAAFKVFLAYTAHEQLAHAVDLPHWHFPMDGDDQLAAAVRTELNELKAYIDRDSQKRQRVGLDGFWAGTHGDVRFVAYGIRNLVAHGLFTGSRLKARSSQAVLARLAERVLHADEVWFSEWATLED